MELITPLLTVGAQFEMYGCEFEVAGLHDHGLRCVPIKGGTMKHLKVAGLAELVNRNDIKVTYTPPRATEAAGTEMRSSLNEHQLNKFNRQLRWIHAIFARIPDKCRSQRAIAEIVPEIRAELQNEKAPGISTLSDWMTRWVKGGRQDSALLPKLRRTRVDNSRLDELLRKIIDASIQSIYLTRQRNPMSAVYADVLMKVANHNAESAKKLTMPSQETIRKIIHRIDLYERDLQRHGRHFARRRHRAAGAGFVAQFPLDLCMADGQLMDIVLIEPPRDDGEPPQEIGRAYITIVIDVRTRCILAAYVSLAPFCGATLLKTMAIAVVAEVGRPRGIMRTLLVDNGSDYRDNAFARFCSNLDIVVEPCPPKVPNSKSIVERVIRTLTTDLIQKLPGTTFSNPTARGDYDSQKYARVTLKDLRAHVDTWVNEIYHQRPHRSLGRAPMAVWNAEVQS